MEWEMILLLVLGLPFALYGWTKTGLGRMKKLAQSKSVA
jgi:hypothetical protein